MKRVLVTMCMLLAVSLLWGCFKDVVDYTIYKTSIYEQLSNDVNFKPATDVETYAYWVDTTQWKVASWEDAVAHRITNKTTGEQRDVPDAYGSFNASDEYQSVIRLDRSAMIVMLFPQYKVYAYRKYELPENLAEALTKLYVAMWRPSHSAAGWRVVTKDFTPPVVETPDGGDDDNGNGDNGDGDDTNTDTDTDTE